MEKMNKIYTKEVKKAEHSEMSRALKNGQELLSPKIKSNKNKK